MRLLKNKCSCRRETAHLAKSLKERKLDPVVLAKMSLPYGRLWPRLGKCLLAPGRARCSPGAGSLSCRGVSTPGRGQTPRQDNALTLLLGGVLRAELCSTQGNIPDHWKLPPLWLPGLFLVCLKSVPQSRT